ncbi:MAG: hypothetical protein U1E17_02850 [Geminicoccaceae bacterium]
MKSTGGLAIAVGFMLAFGGSQVAMAASPTGEWNLRFFNEPGLISGSTIGICFLPDRTFYSTTFSSWSGTWFQKGDRLRFVGETSSGEQTAHFGQFAANNSAAGEYKSNLDAATFNANWTLVKISSVCRAPARSARATGPLSR